MLERGIAITYVGWQREDRTFLQSLNLDQIAQGDPAAWLQAIVDGIADDQIASNT
jgi:hypothetical protein